MLRSRITVWLLVAFLLFAGGCTETTVPPLKNTTTSSPTSVSSSTATTGNAVTTLLNTTTTTTESAPPSGNLSHTAATWKDIPAYSGEPFAVVQNNLPCFLSSSITTQAFELYSNLDALGRCGPALACCGKEIMPTETRGNISAIKPSGWVQAQYDHIQGAYLYNRCHLIGWQLSAENANPQNLITGTKHLNVEGMLPFENMVADYIKETDNHVMYRITPWFNGENLLPSGVQMEAYSVEDDGEGICFNVYCYNVQPGVTLDYATGNSALASAPTTTTQASAMYVLNTNTKKIHYPHCSSVKTIKETNRQEYTGTTDTLFAQGYTTCGNCF